MTAGACPACGAPNPRPITYGYDLAIETDDQINRGCLRPTDAPEWQCRTCGDEWAHPPTISTTPCPDCGELLHRRPPATLHCPQCRYTRTGGTDAVFDPATPADRIVELLDIDYDNTTNADGEPINWDGQTRAEELEMYEFNLAEGNVYIDGVGWLVHDDAVAEVGPEAVAMASAELQHHVDSLRSDLATDPASGADPR